MESQTDVEYRKITAFANSRSLGIVLPKKFLIALGIKKGNFVKITQSDNSIVVEKA